MAHNLYMGRDGAARMMYVGQLPWHGLGTPLERPATSAEAIAAAGLDWTVKKVPLYAIEGAGAAVVHQYCAVVPEDRWGKDSDCPVFGIVGKDYVPLQNTAAFEFFDSVVGEGAAVYHTAGALGQGEQVWILAKLPGMMEFSEPIEKYVLLSTGHDGRTCVRILLTPVRVVCQNTLTLALQEGEQVAQAYHTPSLQKQLDAAGRKLKALNSGFEKMAAAFRAMRGVPIDEEGVAQYMKKVFPDPETPTPGRWAARTESTRTACIQLFHDGMGNGDPEAKGTLWAAYNGVTEYVDHWRPAVGRERMFTVCFGRGYQVKTRAFRTACEMAGCTWQN